jgi:formylglycine-generating enzyme required for sulfatase activity
MMGCNASLDTVCEPDEYPLHEVTLDAFFLDRREVSMAEYAPCVSAGVCAVPTDDGKVRWDPAGTPNDPVVDVTRADAEVYCAWLGKRLPSEAEWEKAARGTDGRVYAWGNDPPRCDLANYLACGNRVEPVETHSDVLGPYGTINQSGNVWEWTADYYAASYYASSPAANPHGPATGTTWVIRGGSWDWEGHALRVSRRLEWDHPTWVIGIRCALDAEP